MPSYRFGEALLAQGWRAGLNTVVRVGYSRTAGSRLNTSDSPHASFGLCLPHTLPTIRRPLVTVVTKAQYLSLCGLLTRVLSRAQFRKYCASNCLLLSEPMAASVQILSGRA